jgi:ribosomal protein S18 acetylase RimI-like enzyme
MATIRRAMPEDIPGIAEVIQDAFSLEIDQVYARDLLVHGSQQVTVAIENGKTVGFVAGFVTTTLGAVPRWEVDLLAVRQDYQRHQIAIHLLEATWQDAQQSHAKFARGLIQVENTASQRAFERAGYTSSGQVYDMHLWEPLDTSAEFPAREMVTAIPVDTLTYRGLWIEGLESPMVNDEKRRQYVAGARAQAAREERHHTSALIPVDKSLPSDLRTEARIVGQYQWWRKP